jgi:tRNA uridine 5-carbamoylmethylation protein Kti12
MVQFPEVQEGLDWFSWEQPNRRWVIVMRGLPGSGKTTFANQMVAAANEKGFRAVICSADRFFIEADGVYRYRRDRLADAHEFCQDQFDIAMAIDDRDDENYADIVIIDNTSIRQFEYGHYRRAALRGRHEFTAYVMVCHGEDEALRQNARSVHYIPNSTVLGRFAAFERDEDYDFHVYPIY